MAVVARLIAALIGVRCGDMALAQAGTPDGAFNWQMDFQNPATLVMEYIDWFSWYTRRSS